MAGENQEIKTFFNIWLAAISSLYYCHIISSRIPRGTPRLLSLLPVITLLTVLPLRLTGVHLAGVTTLYFVWLANSKLLLFAFDLGPLSSDKSPRLPFLHFLCLALLPINRKGVSNTTLKKSHRPIFLGLKALLLAGIVCVYAYRETLHPNIILGLYCCHVYLGVELILAMTAFLVRVLLGSGFEIEPQFDEPYMATSLQDFWGRRWNLVVTGILRPTVYNPVRAMCTRMLGRSWGTPPAIFATFLVSGLMHEVIFFYLTRARPTWEVTCFFLLHGVCTAVEVAVKKSVGGRFRLHRVVSGLLTVGFAAVTGVWLFLPQLIRNGVDVKAINEYSELVNFVRNIAILNKTKTK